MPVKQGKLKRRAGNYHPNQTSWKKGESGNPNGRQRHKKPLADCFREALAEEHGKTGKTYNEALVQKLIDLAMAGNVTALTYIFDRALGKPRQSLELGGDIRHLAWGSERDTHGDNGS